MIRIHSHRGGRWQVVVPCHTQDDVRKVTMLLSKARIEHRVDAEAESLESAFFRRVPTKESQTEVSQNGI